MEKPLLLQVENLCIQTRKAPHQQLVRGLTFELKAGHILGLVGESGSGKSVSTAALMGLLPPKALEISQGSILYQNRDLVQITNREWQQLRGRELAMVFQEPMSALNPSMRCGEQVMEVIELHQKLSKSEARLQALALFEKVKLPVPEQMLDRYPHELSGGQKQRVVIAMAIANKPQLLIADEPTTALDVTVQKEIIQLLKELQQESGMSIIFISHDLSLVSEIADEVMVMYKGEVVEQGTAEAVFHHPKHVYTQALIASRPQLGTRPLRLPTITDVMQGREAAPLESPEARQTRHQELWSQAPLLEVQDVSKTYISRVGFWGKAVPYHAVDSVSFSLYEGETLGLVGESGCGKSTLSNALLNLEPATSGAILYRGRDLRQLSDKEWRLLRREIQIIFQDPYASLNPRLTVGQAIMEPMQVHGMYAHDAERRAQTEMLLEQVGLTAEHFNRYPHEFSGGQRQRIGIARAIALKPKLIICDESVSALDISVQAQVLNLLNDLKDAFGFSYLFISHDLSVVQYFSDRIMVMQKGQLVELAEADALYAQPQKDYTRQLLAAIPKGK